MNEFLPSSELNSIAAHTFCGKDSLFLPVCTNILFLIAGFSPNQLNTVSNFPKNLNIEDTINHQKLVIFRQCFHFT